MDLILKEINKRFKLQDQENHAQKIRINIINDKIEALNGRNNIIRSKIEQFKSRNEDLEQRILKVGIIKTLLNEIILI